MAKRKKAPRTTMAEKVVITKKEEIVEETNVLVETNVKENEHKVHFEEETVTEQETNVKEETVTEQEINVERKANELEKPVQKENGATVDNPKISLKVGEKDKSGWLLRFREKINGKVLDLWESPGGKRWIVCNPITDRKGVDLLKTDDFAKAKLLVVKMSEKQV